MLEVLNSNSAGKWREFDVDTNSDNGKVTHGASVAKNIANGIGNLVMAPISIVTMPYIAWALSPSLAVSAPLLFLAKGLKDLAIDAPMHGVAMLLGK